VNILAPPRVNRRGLPTHPPPPKTLQLATLGWVCPPPRGAVASTWDEHRQTTSTPMSFGAPPLTTEPGSARLSVASLCAKTRTLAFARRRDRPDVAPRRRKRGAERSGRIAVLAYLCRSRSARLSGCRVVKTVAPGHRLVAKDRPPQGQSGAKAKAERRPHLGPLTPMPGPSEKAPTFDA
jgi:hypothetical protein